MLVIATCLLSNVRCRVILRPDESILTSLNVCFKFLCTNMATPALRPSAGDPYTVPTHNLRKRVRSSADRCVSCSRATSVRRRFRCLRIAIRLHGERSPLTFHEVNFKWFSPVEEAMSDVEEYIGLSIWNKVPNGQCICNLKVT